MEYYKVVSVPLVISEEEVFAMGSLDIHPVLRRLFYGGGWWVLIVVEWNIQLV
jgi:hypothetical protein